MPLGAGGGLTLTLTLPQTLTLPLTPTPLATPNQVPEEVLREAEYGGNSMAC